MTVSREIAEVIAKRDEALADILALNISALRDCIARLEPKRPLAATPDWLAQHKRILALTESCLKALTRTET